jgi:YD repeat-containing protein
MNINHKKTPARNLTITGLILAGILAIPLPAQAEQVTHSYDNLNRLIRSDYGNGNVIDYAYDAAGNRTSQKVTTATVPNQPPIANAGSDQTVRLGSLVTLNGSASADPDNGPSPLSYVWTQADGPGISLIGATTVRPKFAPTVKGLYTFGLVVNDGLANSTSASVKITVPTLGDIDLDGDVDNNDLAKITAVLNKPANGPNDLRDINGDMKLDALDSRKLVLLCTKPRCAI